MVAAVHPMQPLCQPLLHGVHVDTVVVGGVECGGRRRWNPSTARTRQRVLDLLIEHVGHQVGRSTYPAFGSLGSPQAIPTSTFQSSYACIQRCAFISLL